MRNLFELDAHRLTTPEVKARFGNYGDDTCGVFIIRHPATGIMLRCVASCGDGWDHVSVSSHNRPPNWAEMSFIKRKFFNPQETVMQLHVAEADHIDVHPHCLHLFRPQHVAIPLPPKEFV